MSAPNQPSHVALWGMFELSLPGPSDGNPFIDVTLAATFRQDEREVKVTGFYDGGGIYRMRFMPDATGRWSYNTASNRRELDGLSGALEVGPAAPGSRGPVHVANGFHFKYADGSRFISIGTTAYVWNLQGEAAEQQTLATLAKAPFTKIRMCVFPKHYRYNQNEPELYPYALLGKGDSSWPGHAFEGWSFDFERFEPAYFRHLERRIADLAAIGVQADVILFHPYDRWGFSRMTPEQDDYYLRYVVARLAAFPNVWWSMANEYDFMTSKSLADWNRFIQVVSENDPYGHLLSVHNGFAPFDYTHPKITHVSIQRQDTSRALQWRQMSGKPICDDECSYEGDIAEDWGNISGREMVHRFWSGTVNGGYITHGETFYNEAERIWWAKGGELIGESPKRIAFLRRILEEGPDDGLDPMPYTGHFRITMGGGLDVITLPDLLAPAPGEETWVRARIHYATAGQAHRYYLSYFGGNQPSEVSVVVPPGERYVATLIDTWEMTETEIGASVERGDLLRFRGKPFQALLLRRIDG